MTLQFEFGHCPARDSFIFDARPKFCNRPQIRLLALFCREAKTRARKRNEEFHSTALVVSTRDKPPCMSAVLWKHQGAKSYRSTEIGLSENCLSIGRHITFRRVLLYSLVCHGKTAFLTSSA